MKGGLINYKFENGKLTSKPDAKADYLWRLGVPGCQWLPAGNCWRNKDWSQWLRLNYISGIHFMPTVEFSRKENFWKLSKYRSHLVSHLSSKHMWEWFNFMWWMG